MGHLTTYTKFDSNKVVEKKKFKTVSFFIHSFRLNFVELKFFTAWQKFMCRWNVKHEHFMAHKILNLISFKLGGGS